MPTISTALIPARAERSPTVLDKPAQIAWTLLGFKTTIALFLPFLAFTERFSLIVVLLVVAITADILDGWIYGNSALAQSKQHRDWRRIVDTLTDRLLIASTIFPLYFMGVIPATFLALAVVREFAIDVVTVYPYLVRRFVCRPNLPSRIGTLLVGTQTILLALGLPVFDLLIAAILLLSILGLGLYIRRPVMN